MKPAIEPNANISDEGVAEFLSLARSANVFFDIVHDRLTVRAVNPNWRMWAPIRHLLDEIGPARIEACVRRSAGHGYTVH
ncbi:MAG: hypothetical protein BGO82_18675 [Devosia sp. 67-54]|uniref:hypothetical protein n=1 Tax=unclassified Devosia TaxID=196773 RepID=UPI0009610836|nr:MULTISPECIES: hypothetical protein [unclassified Devosia]MBN9304401.1 hypothetical protein [Devosia sp.]OJX18202.1 MAG: hypothetical protein BGO82_18675 [Devosia sp. 67-54]